MTDETTCPQCHRRLPLDTPPESCPRCQMARNLETTVSANQIQGESPQPETVMGPYRLGSLLGRGGMGSVYRAEQLDSGRYVALKVLSHKLESMEHRRRFFREGRLAASISHPHSVYVFGTDEVNGTPIIAMELAAGGTLENHVQEKGPLVVGEAVDAILQVIEGLEAVETAGILHRDVKPSNCFLDGDGVVKIGDFGLSISTSGRAEENLTQTGVFLGTPAYSSPEQIRGDDLDVRSDIYAVGVTLFYLLTGQTPFQAKHMAQLLAAVLEQPAPSLTAIRPDIPAGLAQVVERCLSKQREHRFRRYDDLRRALMPYASASPTPATLGLRLLAYGMDIMLIQLAFAMLPLLWSEDLSTWITHATAIVSAEPSSEQTLAWLGFVGLLGQVGYFAVTEGWWGRTAGKAICRLRVVDVRREPPGVCRATARVIVLLAPYQLPHSIAIASDLWLGTQWWQESSWLFILGTIAQVCLFSTVRRKNGFAGVHELVSGTRVVRAVSCQYRPDLVSAVPDPLDLEGLEAGDLHHDSPSKQMIGPYHILARPDVDSTDSLLLGYDARLLRKVWIRTCEPDARPLPEKLRELSRMGRLRWLNGRRSAEECWDAYEAPTGKPMLALLGRRNSWNAVRFWLLDIAEELRTAQADNSLPEVLDLDRVWITADGRAKLLDFPAPGIPEQSNLRGSALPDSANFREPPVLPRPSAAMFLKRVAIAALSGSIVSPQEAEKFDVAIPLPLAARRVLGALGPSEQVVIPVEKFKELTGQPSEVSQAKRRGILAICWIAPILSAVLGAVFHYEEQRFVAEFPAIGELADYVAYYRSLDEFDERRDAVEVLVVRRHRDLLMAPDTWSIPGVDGFIDSSARELLKDFLEKHPNLSEQQVEVAEQQLASYQWQIQKYSSSEHSRLDLADIPWVLLMMSTAVLVVLVIIPSFLTVIVLGNSLLFRLLDIAIVTGSGMVASRSRVLWRNTILWSIVLLALMLLLALADRGHFRIPALFLVGLIMQLFLAERGLHDRLAGTWLVPR